MTPLPGLIGEAKPVRTRVDRGAIKAAIAQAIVACDMNQKVASDVMDIDEGQFSRQLAKGSLPIGALLDLGPDVWRVLGPALMELSGAEQPDSREVVDSAAVALMKAARLVGRLEQMEKSA